jgi:hypothetical protein
VWVGRTSLETRGIPVTGLSSGGRRLGEAAWRAGRFAWLFRSTKQCRRGIGLASVDRLAGYLGRVAERLAGPDKRASHVGQSRGPGTRARRGSRMGVASRAWGRQGALG